MPKSISRSVAGPGTLLLLFMRRASRAAVRIFCLAALTPALAHAGSLVIPGSGSPELILRELASAFNAAHSGDRVEVPPSSRSVGGIHAVKNDEAVMARVSRRPAGEDADGLRYAAFARDAVVFAAGKAVPAQGFSSAQLADIFSGRVTDWASLGLRPNPIRVVVRNQTESNLMLIKERLTPFRDISFSSDAKLAYHAYEMVALLGKYETAIGFASLSALKGASAGVHPLRLDGIAPTPENIASEKYPLLIEYGLVYKKNRLDDTARRFLDFIFSARGRQVLLDNGLVPLALKPE